MNIIKCVTCALVCMTSLLYAMDKKKLTKLPSSKEIFQNLYEKNNSPSKKTNKKFFKKNKLEQKKPLLDREILDLSDELVTSNSKYTKFKDSYECSEGDADGIIFQHDIYELDNEKKSKNIKKNNIVTARQDEYSLMHEDSTLQNIYNKIDDTITYLNGLCDNVWDNAFCNFMRFFRESDNDKQKDE